MPKVFVVTQGSYSYYHIVGVFSSREKAIEICPAVNDPEPEAVIEEWDLDEIDGGLLQYTYITKLDTVTGAVLDSWKSHEPAVHPRDWCHVVRRSPEQYPNLETDQITALSVVSPEHSMKIAVEARQAYLRQKGFEHQPATD